MSVFRIRLPGDTVTEISRRLGVDRQTVRDRWWPIAPALVAESDLDWAYAVPHPHPHATALVRLGLEGPRQ